MEQRPPLFWPSVLVSFLSMLAIGWLVMQQRYAMQTTMPFFKSLGQLLPRHYLLPGLILGLGASLGEETIKRSMRHVMLGAVIIAAASVLFFLIDYGFTIVGMRNADEVSGGATSFFMIFLSPIVAIWQFAPLMLGGIATAIITHAILNAVNDMPMPWAEEGASYDVIGGGMVLAAAGVIFFMPYAIAIMHAASPNMRAEAVISRLRVTVPEYSKNPADFPFTNTAQGRAYIADEVQSLHKAFSAVQSNPCTKQSVAASADYYFQYIRIYEDWKPGTPLSSYSQDALDVVKRALDKHYIGWNDLADFVQIHLDAEMYRDFTKQKPSTCK
jgi:hypothetical protein